MVKRDIHNQLEVFIHKYVTWQFIMNPYTLGVVLKFLLTLILINFKLIFQI
jgi:hypothetical protein